MCFTFMCALLSCLHTCMLSSDIKLANGLNIRNQNPNSKWHNVSYRYVSYVQSKTTDIWGTGAWFLKSSGEWVEENHIYDLAKPNSTVKSRTVYIEGVTYVTKFFWKMDKLTLKAKFEY